MIQLQLHDQTYIALTGDTYAHRDVIKALADYPEVKWDSGSRRWLIHAGLLDKLIYYLGEHVTGSVDFWMGYPLEPVSLVKARKLSRAQVEVERRKKAREDLKEAQRWGRMLTD